MNNFDFNQNCEVCLLGFDYHKKCEVCAPGFSETKKCQECEAGRVLEQGTCLIIQNNTGVIVGSVVGAVAMVALAALGVFLWKRKRV